MYRVGVLIFSNVKLACSEGSAKYLYFKAKRAEIILNGTNLNKFDIEKYNYKNNGCANFIHIGRYDKQKNQKFLLEVFSNLLKLMPNSTMKLVGYGEDEDIIKKRIVEDDLIGKVEMLPPDSDIPKLLASSDFMIFPSVYEGFPNVQIEAQIMGVVCFVSDSVTLESDLGLTTYIPLDIKPSQWAETIFNKVKLHDYSLRPTISKIQKERIDVNKLAKRYIEIYNNSQD